MLEQHTQKDLSKNELGVRSSLWLGVGGGGVGAEG